ncbi:hypothetical protein VTI74DRAFT_3666 [Chaetomium olivicolor]
MCSPGIIFSPFDFSVPVVCGARPGVLHCPTRICLCCRLSNKMQGSLALSTSVNLVWGPGRTGLRRQRGSGLHTKGAECPQAGFLYLLRSWRTGSAQGREVSSPAVGTKSMGSKPATSFVVAWVSFHRVKVISVERPRVHNCVTSAIGWPSRSSGCPPPPAGNAQPACEVRRRWFRD